MYSNLKTTIIVLTYGNSDNRLIERDMMMTNKYYVFSPKELGRNTSTAGKQSDAEQKRKELIKQAQRDGGLHN
ncbi:hypothetical protein BCU70_19375 [Vibrio sp. 10N.286.49.C2]|uniref:hypothetical protein n=1 Tax=Vibrio sp. 10N.286.48.B7 TaxID=1880853 RepID=UPI000C85BC2F|nr:hypothetical protein [Vibrio sp. 10N.286.48.B7]PMH34823.1 hypothetical protein BCU70_19375 [Vibrio sp. 10N.286.49.C2]PMH51389.1 hypothetical protein BCU66_16740 [Vibrio sp. 10N.286.49.B1]PMH83620.1 hypothetical protein BCU58_14115 [Vibrio sp. 10N.286.48.B7]